MGLWGPGGASVGPKGAGGQAATGPEPLKAHYSLPSAGELGAELCTMQTGPSGSMLGLWAPRRPSAWPPSLTRCGRQTHNRSLAAVSQGP